MNLKIKKKNKEIPKQSIPIRDIDDMIETYDKGYVMVLKIVDPINTDLLGKDDLMPALNAIQDCLNTLQASAQISISSEKIDIEQYIDYLKNKANQAKDAYTLDRIQKKIEYLNERSSTTETVLNFYFPIKSQYKKPQDAYDELHDLTKTFVEYLNIGDMTAKVLGRSEAMKLLYEKLNPNTSLVQPYTNDFNLRNICPDVIKDHGNYLEMDEMYYSFHTFSYFPDEVETSWLKRIANTRANIDLSINLAPAEKTKIIDQTNNRLQNIEGKLLEKIPPKTKKKYEKQQKSLEELLEELQNDAENIFDMTFVCALRENSVEELKSAEKRFKTSVSSSKLRSRKLSFKGNFLMWYTLPICFTNKDLDSKINWPMQSSTVASILPFDSSQLQYNEGILKGFHALKYAPITYDRYNANLFNNPNEIVLGESGSGKSFYLKLDMLRQSTSGSSKRLFVIDPEREYFLPNGKRVVFKLGSEYTTNPFHIRSTIIDSDNESEDGVSDVGQYLRRKIGEMMSFFGWILQGLDQRPSEKALLIQGIEEAYRRKGLTYDSTSLISEFPTLSDLKNTLKDLFKERASWLIDTMYPFIDGPYAAMFNGQTNWGFNAKVNVFDIHELSDEIKQPMMDLLLKDIWEEFKLDRDELKGLYVDEAWLLADEDNPQTMKFLREIAKRIRKYGGFLTTATQNVDDFLTIGKYGTAIFKNAHFKTFMRLDEKDIEELKRFMSFSEKELKVLGQKKSKGRCIHLASSKRIEMQTKASPDELSIIDPKQAKELEIA